MSPFTTLSAIAAFVVLPTLVHGQTPTLGVPNGGQPIQASQIIPSIFSSVFESWPWPNTPSFPVSSAPAPPTPSPSVPSVPAPLPPSPSVPSQPVPSPSIPSQPAPLPPSPSLPAPSPPIPSQPVPLPPSPSVPSLPVPLPPAPSAPSLPAPLPPAPSVAPPPPPLPSLTTPIPVSVGSSTVPLSSESISPLSSTAASTSASLATQTLQPSALPPLPSNVRQTFIGISSFTFNPPNAWVAANSTVCNDLTNGESGKMGTQQNASFTFNVPRSANDIFLIAASNPSGGQLEISVNNQPPQVIDLNAASESCGAAELTNHTSQSGPNVPFRIHIKRDDDTPTGEMLITAKILKEPAQVDGAMVRELPSSDSNPLDGNDNGGSPKSMLSLTLMAIAFAVGYLAL